MHNSRRKFLQGAAAGVGLAALGACTVTKSGGLTTVTLNVAKVKAYGDAGINAVSTVLSIAAVATAIGAPTVAIINTASVALQAALDAFSKEAGTSVTVTYDNVDVSAAVDSILADLQTVATDLASALAGASTTVSSSILSDATTALDALKTVVSAFEALIGVVSVSYTPKMTETEALKVLRVG